MEEVKITKSYLVKPAEATPTEVMPLSEFDHVAGATWVPTIYFYKPDEAQLKHHMDSLRESLSRALVHYYPLAGRLRRLEGGRMQLSCDAAGVELIEAELASGASCSQVLGAEMGELVSDTSKFQYLLPAVDVKRAVEEVALLHVQVTHFGCGGFSIGLMMSHAVADGCSAFYFITDWARIGRGEAVETRPNHDRRILRAGEPPKQLSSAVGSKQPDLPIRQPSTNPDSEGPPKETDRVILPLTRAQVDKLKKAANADHHPTPGRRAFSRFEILAAHIWRSTCKARGHESEELRALGIAIDARFRLPSFPKKYFGNTAFVVAARGQAGELISMPIGFTCQRIRQTIEGVTEEYIWSDIEFYKRIDDFSICQELRAMRSTEGPYVNPDPGVISWLSMPLFGLDFGWGGEVHLSCCTPNVDGLAFLYPTRENDGDVVVSISLQVDHIDAFKKHFYDDIM